MKTITYIATIADHAAASVQGDYLLIADAKQYGIDSKEFKESFRVGAIGAILKADHNKGAELLAKAAPLAKGAAPEQKAKRRAKVKAGDVVERTEAEQRVYMAANKRLSDFCRVHSVKPANAARGKPGSNKRDGKGDKDVTPKANNAATADKHIRLQVASLQAYAEKNKALIPDAMRFALAEIAEAIKAIPTQE